MGSVPAHKSQGRTRHGGRWLTLGIVVVVLALIAGGTALVLRSRGSSAAASLSPQIVPLEVIGSTPAANTSAVAPSTR